METPSQNPATQSAAAMPAADAAPAACGCETAAPQPAEPGAGMKFRVMGIVNLTPDSFSDGGICATPQNAAQQAQQLLDEGADILDLGAESTRPTATAISAEEEWARLQPALAAIRPLTGKPLSIDTYKAAVAELALQNGADWINDIRGLQGDDGQMADAVARHKATIVIMHNRSNSSDTGDLIEAVLSFWQRSIERARRAGIAESRIILDPGIGFGKTLEHNWEVLQRFEELRAIGNYPLLIGASRKSFIGNALGLPLGDRDNATLATTVIAAQKGASIFRVHAVRPNVQALAVAARVFDPI